MIQLDVRAIATWLPFFIVGAGIYWWAFDTNGRDLHAENAALHKNILAMAENYETAYRCKPIFDNQRAVLTIVKGRLFCEIHEDRRRARA